MVQEHGLALFPYTDLSVVPKKFPYRIQILKYYKLPYVLDLCQFMGSLASASPVRYAMPQQASNLNRLYCCCQTASRATHLSVENHQVAVKSSLTAFVELPFEEVVTAKALRRLQQNPRHIRCISTRLASSMSTPAQQASPSNEQVSSLPFLRSLLGAIMQPYLTRNPTAGKVLDLIRQREGGPVHYDHFAFRTFAIRNGMVASHAPCMLEDRAAVGGLMGLGGWQADGCGITSLRQIFCNFGYTQRDELLFPAKKLKACWFAPPAGRAEVAEGDGTEGPLPRVFVSELQVEQLSEEAQAILKRYTSVGGQLAKHAALASALGALPWPTPSLKDYRRLARESEYAAWTLVNGYALNHTTVAVHHLRSDLGEINGLNAFLQEQAGVRLNAEGSILKESPDGGLLQSSTVADFTPFRFADGEEERVPASYIEFAERLVLPEFAHLPSSQNLEVEWHQKKDNIRGWTTSEGARMGLCQLSYDMMGDCLAHGELSQAKETKSM